MNDILLTPIRLNELETLIQNSVERAIKANRPQHVESKNETEQLITFDGLAELLHISKTTAYSNHSKGLIPGGCKQGKRVLFDKQVVLNWIKSGRKLSNAEIEAKAEAYLSNSKRKGGNYGK
jgi:hypothetical protein